jgi:hypothetical protein
MAFLAKLKNGCSKRFHILFKLAYVLFMLNNLSKKRIPNNLSPYYKNILKVVTLHFCLKLHNIDTKIIYGTIANKPCTWLEYTHKKHSYSFVSSIVNDKYTMCKKENINLIPEKMLLIIQPHLAYSNYMIGISKALASQYTNHLPMSA